MLDFLLPAVYYADTLLPLGGPRPRPLAPLVGASRYGKPTLLGRRPRRTLRGPRARRRGPDAFPRPARRARHRTRRRGPRGQDRRTRRRPLGRPEGHARPARGRRRVPAPPTLDLAGRIPRYDEVRDFLDDRRPDKRQRTIEALLASEAYGRHYTRHFTNVW